MSAVHSGYNFTCYWRHRQETTNCFSLPELEYNSSEFNSSRGRQHLTKYVSWNNRNEDLKSANSFFKWCFRRCRRRGILRSLICWWMCLCTAAPSPQTKSEREGEVAAVHRPIDWQFRDIKIPRRRQWRKRADSGFICRLEIIQSISIFYFFQKRPHARAFLGSFLASNVGISAECSLCCVFLP